MKANTTKAKAVLFDLDGVLVNSMKAWFYVINDTLNYFGFKSISFRQFKSRFGASIEHDAETLYNGKPINDIEKAYNKFFGGRRKYVKLSHQAKPVLKDLKRKNIKIGLITNSTKYITLITLEYFKLKKYFDVIVTMNDVRYGKPKPNMVLKACKMLKVNPSNTILVGDTKNDMIAGKRAGCVTVGFKIKGDCRINKLKEILYMFKHKHMFTKS